MKGIGPIISLLVILLIAIVLMGTAWAFIFANFTSMTSNCMEMIDYHTNKMCLRNCGTAEMSELDISIAGEQVGYFGLENEISPGTAECFTIKKLPEKGYQDVTLYGRFFSKHLRLNIPLAWVINASERGVMEEGKTYLIIEGNVYLNDETKAPYANRNLTYRLDEIPEDILETDSLGRFLIKKEWNFTYLLPGQVWDIAHEYDPTDPDRLAGGRIKVDGVIDELQTIGVEDLSSTADKFHTIRPLEILPDRIKLQVIFNISLHDISKPAGSELWLWTGFPDEDLTTAEILDIECGSTGDYTCYDNDVANIVYSDLIDKYYNALTIPQTGAPDGFNGSYFPVNLTVSTDSTGAEYAGMRIDGSLFYWSMTEGDWVKIINGYLNEKLLIEGGNATIDKMLTLAEINESLYKLGVAGVNQVYGLNYYGLTNNYHSYGMERLSEGKIVFKFLNPYPKSTDITYSPKRELLFRFNNAQPNTDYGVVFNITLERNDTYSKYFKLPRTIRTFGFVKDDVLNVTLQTASYDYIFSSDENVYYRTMLRIPSQASKAMYYTTYEGREGGTVKLRHYIMNTGSTNIGDIILYLTEGDYYYFENSYLSEGCGYQCVEKENQYLFLRCEGNVGDYSVHDNDMYWSVTDIYTYRAGHPGLGCNFSDVDNRYVYRDDLILSDGFPGKSGSSTEEMSFSAWIKPNTVDNNMIMAKDDTDQRSYLFFLENSKLRAQVHSYDDATGLIGNLDIVPGVWTHVVFNYKHLSGSNYLLQIFVNGTLDRAGVVVGPINGSLSDFRIGNRASAGVPLFNGIIDEINIFNQSLTEDQIGRLYDNTWLTWRGLKYHSAEANQDEDETLQTNWMAYLFNTPFDPEGFDYVVTVIGEKDGVNSTLFFQEGHSIDNIIQNSNWIDLFDHGWATYYTLSNDNYDRIYMLTENMNGVAFNYWHSLWLWYLNAMPMWENHAFHKVTFRTVRDPGKVEGYYEYEFYT